MSWAVCYGLVLSAAFATAVLILMDSRVWNSNGSFMAATERHDGKMRSCRPSKMHFVAPAGCGSFWEEGWKGLGPWTCCSVRLGDEVGWEKILIEKGYSV